MADRLPPQRANRDLDLEEEVRDLRGRANTVERPIICKSIAMRRLIETVDRVVAIYFIQVYSTGF